MSRIILFHRMDLTGLYGAMAPHLADYMDVIHLAYGDDEETQLRGMGVRGEIVNFKRRIGAMMPDPAPDAEELAGIDALFQAQSNGAFNLNAAIQSDRGFALLDYPEALRMTALYTRFWRGFLDETGAQFVLHEPCTLMLNFTAAMLLAERGGAYVYPIMVPGPKGTLNHLFMTGFDFTCPDLDRCLSKVNSGELPVDGAGDAFLAEFRSDYDNFLGGTVGSPVSLPRMAIKALVDGLRNARNRRRHDRLAANIDHWRYAQNRGRDKLRNLWGYRRHLRYDALDQNADYYFYPLHLEPEAVVLYHGHGIYEGQVKLIQNIAASLPPGTWLYVKDHPHDRGYRALADYLAMQKVPNVRLLDPGLSGKEVIAHARGVITITGTAGFEALLLGKEVQCFGKTFYSGHGRVGYLRHIRDLRAALKNTTIPEDDADLLPFLAAYLAALKPGLTDYFAGRATRYGIDLNSNAAQVARGLAATLGRLGR